MIGNHKIKLLSIVLFLKVTIILS